MTFLRLPVTGPLVEEREEQELGAASATWDRLVRENGIPAIHFNEGTRSCARSNVPSGRTCRRVTPSSSRNASSRTSARRSGVRET